jgi:type I restriction enzyme, S subunit
MAAEWRLSSIGDLCDAGVAELQTGPFGSQLHAYDYVEDGIPVVPTEAIRNRQIDHSLLPRISSAKAEALARHRLRPGDILFARRGVQATGHIGCVREAEDGFICGTGAIRLRVNDKGGEVTPDFLSHVLANPASVEWFKFHAIGATMPNLNEGIIRSFPLAIPPVSEQRAIAHILGTLDDKIELNRRMNETLEAMARALFKSWFVDFDPVRAKAEGRDPGLPKPLADLFPARLVDSELGEIPEGWEVCGLGQCLALLKDGSHNPPSRVPNGIPFIAGATDVKDFNIDFSKCTYITEDDYRAIHRNWTIRAGDVLLTIVGTVGNVALVSQDDLPFSLQRSIAVLRPGPTVSSSFLYCLLKSTAFRADVQARLNPTAQPGIYLGTLGKIPICLPMGSLIAAFDDVALTIVTMMQNIVKASRTLIALRDTLLPKLISGELRTLWRRAVERQRGRNDAAH